LIAAGLAIGIGIRIVERSGSPTITPLTLTGAGAIASVGPKGSTALPALRPQQRETAPTPAQAVAVATPHSIPVAAAPLSPTTALVPLAPPSAAANAVGATAPTTLPAPLASQPTSMQTLPRQAKPAPTALAAPPQPPSVAATQNVVMATKPTLQSPGTPAAALPGTAALLPTQPHLPDRMFSNIPVAGGAPRYPAALAADGRLGEVSVECRIGTDGRPNRCRVLKSNAVPFSATVSDWLKSDTLRFAPIVRNGEAVSETHRWSVRVEESAEARRTARAAEPPAPVVAPTAPPAPQPPPAAVTPKLVAEAPSPSAADHPFAPRLLTRSAPDYPEEYADQNLAGRVDVSCMIDTNGQPSGCKVLHVEGGGAFGTAVEQWLHSGTVHFAPIVRAGVKVAERHTWAVEIHP
jgi:outer membrane biosynthesis protein TonB